jgi:hypothetical protein
MAQTTLRFTLKQPPALVADAGGDKTIKEGEQVLLGAAEPATGGLGNYTYHWTPSTGLDRADVANPTASPMVTTTYTLTVEDGGGCARASSVTVTVSSVTGLEDITGKFGLSVFPNPSNGSFSVTSAKELGKGAVLLQVFNPIGALIHSETISGRKKLDQTVRLPSLSKGIYILRISGSDLNVIHKVIVQ